MPQFIAMPGWDDIHFQRPGFIMEWERSQLDDYFVSVRTLLYSWAPFFVAFDHRTCMQSHYTCVGSCSLYAHTQKERESRVDICSVFYDLMENVGWSLLCWSENKFKYMWRLWQSLHVPREKGHGLQREWWPDERGCGGDVKDEGEKEMEMRWNERRSGGFRTLVRDVHAGRH